MNRYAIIYRRLGTDNQRRWVSEPVEAPWQAVVSMLIHVRCVVTVDRVLDYDTGEEVTK